MSKSKSNALLLLFTVVLAGLSMTNLQPPLTARSQQDYEEYIIMENVDQSINQKNTGSGTSTNINCGTNAAGSNLQPIQCPQSTPTPGAGVVPVVTQRAVTEQKSGGGVYSVTAPCNPDEVVTGGGYDFSMLTGAASAGSITKEFAVGNAWYVETLNFPPEFNVEDAMTVYAECLKMVPS
jgi:hypothetical protein